MLLLFVRGVSSTMVSTVIRVTLIALAGAALVALASCGDDGSPPLLEPSGRIAFSTDRDGNAEVYVMNADGTGATNISNDPATDDDPAWSPDGRSIAFQSNRSGLSDIWIMDADGGNPRQVTSDGGVNGMPRWSPDGARLAYFSFVRQSRGYLWVANADGSDEQPVLAAIHPATPDVQCGGGFPGGWFPDGERIVFRGSYGGGNALQICSAKPDGSDIRPIYSEENASATFPALSPDGKKIAFASNGEGNNEIYVIDADGGNRKRLTMDSGLDLMPSWSPDGQWIVFASDRDGDFELYIIRPDGSDLRQLTNNTVADTMPSWSPE